MKKVIINRHKSKETSKPIEPMTMNGNSINNEQELSVSSLTLASTKEENCIDNCGGNDKENMPQLPNASLCGGVSDGSVQSSKEIAAVTTTTDDALEKSILSRPREAIAKEISKQVLRHKLQKLRHLVLEGVVSKDYLDNEIFHPKLLQMFNPQTVMYNGGIANVKKWKISCYLEVMEGGVPCTNPHLELRNVFLPLLETCDDLFMLWYKQQHSCNNKSRFRSSSNKKTQIRKCRRLMTFVTRYTPAPGEQALLKHIDGAGKVDGSCVVALPVDRWSAPESVNSWHGHGGGLTFWDGRELVPEDEEKEPEEGDKSQRSKRRPKFRPKEIHYETRSGDVAFIDRAVWHQADPITKGTRWALVIFYKVIEEEGEVAKSVTKDCVSENTESGQKE